MILRYHGGFCCGMRHLTGFQGLNQCPAAAEHRPVPNANNPESINRAYRRPLAPTYEAEFDNIMGFVADGTKCVEVILNDSQIERFPKWVDKLKDNGFRLVTRFKNNNMSWCNVFHRVNKTYRDAKVPDWWKNAGTKKKGK